MQDGKDFNEIMKIGKNIFISVRIVHCLDTFLKLIIRLQV